MQRRISIVTISYNQAEFLDRTIRSVLDQDYENLEYIVVDPGSTDGSREIIERYKSRISHIVFRPDRGAADGLNNGFSLSTGEVLGFVNSDDVLLPDALSSAMRFLDQNTGIDIVSGHGLLIDRDEKALRRLYSDRMSASRYLYGGVVLIQPATFFTRRIFERVGGFNANNRTSWDGELFLQMARAGGRFAIMNDFWAGFRVHPGSITASKRLEAATLEDKRELFRRINGRDSSALDTLIGYTCRLYRHALNPRDTIERIRRGPVFGRCPSGA